MAHLLLENGVHVALDTWPFVIGRNPQCALQVADLSTSRDHARLIRENGEILIEDLGSRHGTFVNGERVTEPRVLAEADVILLGDNRLLFQLDPEDREVYSITLSTLAAAADTTAQIEVLPEEKLRALLGIIRSLLGPHHLEDLLPKILDSVLRIFPKAQRAVVLLVDAETGEIRPRAIRNRDPSVEDSPRVSQTVVKRALEQREAILCKDAHLDSQFQESQSISNFGIRSVICAPLVTHESEPLGVLNVQSEDKGPSFDDDDLNVLVSIAGTIAMALENARLYEEQVERERLEREAELARAVQLRFLPAAPPRIPDYSFFHHYDPARFVGGDYFGYIELPGDRMAIAMGDVSGKGVPAALLMARLSSDVRFSVLAAADPAVALQSVNRSMAEAELEDKFVTLLIMILDHQSHTLTVANAGHLYPLLRHPDGTVEEVGRGTAGFPLNVSLDPEYEYRAVTVELEPGACLLACTDGVIEARDAAGGFFGLEELGRLLGEASPEAETAGARVIEELQRFSSGEPQHDDTTLICLGRVASSETRAREEDSMDPEIFRTTVPAHPRNLKLIRDFIHDVAGQRLGEAADMVVLAVDESCSNVLRHQPEPEGRDLTVEVAIDAESVRFSIRNFCCTDDLPKIKPRKLKEVRPGGLGTHFVGEIMDRLDYLPDPERPGRMMLVLEKKLPPEERGG